MQRLGRNLNGYLGEKIRIDDLLRDTFTAAHRHGWTLSFLDAAPGLQLPVLSRPPLTSTTGSPRLYVSAGIHGDEPAGPMAIHRLIADNAWPNHAWLWVCPCLNPTGFQRSTREAASGHDLNRDYRQPLTPEVRAHTSWLQRLPVFDVALCLHEDWESAGFYLYELNPDGRPSLAQPTLRAVADVCPIDHSSVIDGREARQGLICPVIDPAHRPEWPEAFYLLQHKTRLSYTLESPSDFPLEVRVQALATATRACFEAYAASPSAANPAAQGTTGTSTR